MTASRSFPHRIVAEQPIAVPPQTAWAVLADFGKVHLWSPSVAHAELISDVASGPGCARACDVRGFGRIEETVTEWRPGEYLAYEATPLGPLGRSHNRWTVTAAPGGCVVRVELSYGVRFGPVGWLLHRAMMRRKLTRLMAQVLDQLRAHVESGATASTAAVRAQARL